MSTESANLVAREAMTRRIAKAFLAHSAEGGKSSERKMAEIAVAAIEQDPRELFMVVWSGGYEAPTYQFFMDRGDATKTALDWWGDADRESDSIDVIRVNLSTMENERIGVDEIGGEVTWCAKCGESLCEDGDENWCHESDGSRFCDRSTPENEDVANMAEPETKNVAMTRQVAGSGNGPWCANCGRDVAGNHGDGNWRHVEGWTSKCDGEPIAPRWTADEEQS